VSDAGDIVVVGGGLVGSALAIGLARAGVGCTLIERRDDHGAGASGVSRPIALSAASVRLLVRLELWQSLREQVQPIRCVHVSERGRLGRVRMRAAEHGLDALGQVVEASVLEAVLQAALRSESGVWTRFGQTVVGIQSDPDEVILHLGGTATAPGPSPVRARLAVVADGASSGLLAAAGLRTTRHDYAQCALVCSVRPRRAHEGVAYERFLPTGPLALLPLRDGNCGVVWSLPERDAAALHERDDQEFLARLGEAFGGRLGRLLEVSPRRAFGLSRHSTRPLQAARCVCVGNAANRLHPVAGQGLNLGLRDVAQLVELLLDAASTGGDPGGAGLLGTYARLRRADHRRILAFTDLLARGLTGGQGAMGSLRSAGMLGLQLFPPARGALARMAMGLTPPLPAALTELDPLPEPGRGP
jgi:2-octaprenyl-6-methoxyphenol hydroxylase